MTRILFFAAILCAGCAHQPKATPNPTDNRASRSFALTYSLVVPPSDEAVFVAVPIAESNEHQVILEREVLLGGAPAAGELHRDPDYENLYWSSSIQSSKPTEITVAYRIQRFKSEGSLSAPRLSRTERRLFLGPNKRVPVRSPLVDAIRAELDLDGKNDGEKARVIYDYVVDNMEYKKVGTGWGNGDTHWACTEKYGNCTDFHALFISLARAEGIPARFEIGFPVTEEEVEGEIGGYHCWVNYFIEGKGWLPIDASEAKKAPEKRDLFFGTQPYDRVMLTMGRDIQLVNGSELNYFVYPHVEPTKDKLPLTVRFQELSEAG